MAVSAWRRPGSRRAGAHGLDGLFSLQIVEPVFLPARIDSRRVVGMRLDGRRKALVVPARLARVFPRPRGVDQHAVPQSGAELLDVAIFQRRRWIDRRAEYSREYHDAAFAGIDPMRVRPFDLFVGGRIDVLFDHDDVLIAILRGSVAPQRRRDLLGLALVVLLDLDADIDAVGDRRRVDVEDAGDAGAVQNIPGDGGALHRGHHAVLAVGAGQRAFQRAAEDRVAPVGDAGHLHGRPRRRQVGDVAGIFAERPFHLVARRVIADDAFDDDLGAGRYFEIDGLTAHQLRRLAAIAAHDVVFADARRQR